MDHLLCMTMKKCYFKVHLISLIKNQCPKFTQNLCDIRTNCRQCWNVSFLWTTLTNACIYLCAYSEHDIEYAVSGWLVCSGVSSIIFVTYTSFVGTSSSFVSFHCSRLYASSAASLFFTTHIHKFASLYRFLFSSNLFSFFRIRCAHTEKSLLP